MNSEGQAGGICRAMLVLGGALLSGCTSHGLLQTAHTTGASSVALSAGAARVFNEIDEQGGRGTLTNTTGEPGVRVGLSDSIDVGASPFLSRGAELAVKMNLLDNARRLALAPRLAAGYSAPEGRRVWGAELGFIGSYRVLDQLEPYAALGFANHWISIQGDDSPVMLAADQRLASGDGYGDGLVKATLGLQTELFAGSHLLLEYSHWFTAQNDLGDGFAFLPSDVFALAWQSVLSE